jgi:hypothetical protein
MYITPNSNKIHYGSLWTLNFREKINSGFDEYEQYEEPYEEYEEPHRCPVHKIEGVLPDSTRYITSLILSSYHRIITLFSFDKLLFMR